MNRTLVLALLIYGLIFTAIVTLQGALMVLALPLLLYLGVSLVVRGGAPDLAVVRTLSAARVAQREPVTVDVTITNQGESLRSLLVKDLLPPGLKVIDGHEP